MLQVFSKFQIDGMNPRGWYSHMDLVPQEERGPSNPAQRELPGRCLVLRANVLRWVLVSGLRWVLPDVSLMFL